MVPVSKGDFVVSLLAEADPTADTSMPLVEPDPVAPPPMPPAEPPVLLEAAGAPSPWVADVDSVAPGDTAIPVVPLSLPPEVLANEICGVVADKVDSPEVMPVVRVGSRVPVESFVTVSVNVFDSTSDEDGPSADTLIFEVASCVTVLLSFDRGVVVGSAAALEGSVTIVEMESSSVVVVFRAVVGCSLEAGPEVDLACVLVVGFALVVLGLIGVNPPELALT